MQDAGCKIREVRSKKLETSSWKRYCLLPLASCFLLLLTAYCSLLAETAFSEELSSPSTTPNPLPPTSKIGIILPLSGRYAQFGEQALKGALLAADIFETMSQGSKEPTKMLSAS